MRNLDRLYQIKKIASGTKTRNDLEKELKSAKKTYEKSKAEFDRLNSIINDAQTKKDIAQEQMIASRKQILEISDFTRNMDLTGATAVKNRGELDTYFINDKEYHLDVSDVNDVKCTPWKDYKNKKDETKDANDKPSEEDEYNSLDDFEKYFSENHLFSNAIENAIHLLKK